MRVCVASWGTWLLTPTKWRGQGVLRISSTGLWACPHAWLNLTTGNTSCPITSPSGQSPPGLQRFPWLTVTQTARGVRPQPLAIHSSLSYPDAATLHHFYLFPYGCVCMYVSPHLCICPACRHIYMYVYMHKCARKMGVSVWLLISRQQDSHKSPL